MLNKLRLLTLALLLHASASWAVPMDYSFEIDWTGGSLAGTMSTVFVTLDGLTGSGAESFRPGAVPPARLVSLTVSVGGVDFTASDDLSYPIRPELIFMNGALIDVDGILRPTFTNVLSFSSGGVSFNAGTGSGDIDLNSWGPIDDPAVPAPATLALFGLGLIGLCLNRRKRQTHG